MKKVRTRFAPSPTGMLHIGGFRSAFYAWLFARHNGGDFLLRIEDTDRERRVPGAIRYILEGFEWFGIDIDEGPTPEQIVQIDEGEPFLESAVTKKIIEKKGGPFGPYIQSMRLDRYKQISDQLIESGAAFRCDCTPEMLEKERAEQQARKEVTGYSGYCRTRGVSADKPHVVRFKMPHFSSPQNLASQDSTPKGYRPKVVMQDGIRGRIEWEKIPLKDPVLLKSDGFPTYHLAVVVDDHDMQITHVMRGEEWIPSAPLHILLYEALGWEQPIFCHLPVVLGPDGKKLSKRHGSTSWSSFKEEGYLPEALLNFIVRIGWSVGDGDEQEIFTKEELIEKFTLERINSASGVFEYNKLAWMNGVYIRALSDDDFINRASPFLESWAVEDLKGRAKILVPLIKERIKIFTELMPMLQFLKSGKLERETDQLVTKKVTKEQVLDIINGAISSFLELSDFEPTKIDTALKGIVEDLKLPAGAVFMTVRISTLGKKATPPLLESLQVLGRDLVIERLKETKELL